VVFESLAQLRWKTFASLVALVREDDELVLQRAASEVRNLRFWARGRIEDHASIRERQLIVLLLADPDVAGAWDESVSSSLKRTSLLEKCSSRASESSAASHSARRSHFQIPTRGRRVPAREVAFRASADSLRMLRASRGGQVYAGGLLQPCHHLRPAFGAQEAPALGIDCATAMETCQRHSDRIDALADESSQVACSPLFSKSGEQPGAKPALVHHRAQKGAVRRSGVRDARAFEAAQAFTQFAQPTLV
jgi:hypothetical protein